MEIFWAAWAAAFALGLAVCLRADRRDEFEARRRAARRRKKCRPYYDLPYTNDKGFDVVCWEIMWMGDWDLRGPGDTNPNHTITSREEVYSRLTELCTRCPWMGFIVYETPNGVRAFRTDAAVEWGPEAEQLQRRLGVDPAYTRCCPYSWGFCCRVSPKPGRDGDYVARRVGRFGNPTVDPEVAAAISLHDRLIAAAIG